MKYIFLSTLLSFAFALTSCDNNGANMREETDDELSAPTVEDDTPNDNIFRNPDYEDGSDAGDNDVVTYEEASARDSITTQTTDYQNRDSEVDRELKPIYTDDEYEPSFSTSTTNPKNQISGGLQERKEKVYEVTKLPKKQ